ncbi:ABC transporter permease [Cypionkella psychrotolerans]|uniref:ABC transporter permease n=1 Tax=Cypionkella psychrotolerans TaxID=1678131 RepID=UPI000B309557|nr:ABC transporter permease subunit [Cypionkella psychrotolerans]
MDSMSLKDFAAKWTMGLILITAYVFLYMPIVHILFASLSNHPNFPYPPNFNPKSYVNLATNSIYQSAFVNSLIIASCTAVLSTVMGFLATIGVLRFAGKRALFYAVFFAGPLFVSEILLGISSMSLYYLVFGLQGNMVTAIIANSVHCFSFCFLIMAAMLYKYDWRMNEAAIVCGATPFRAFLEVMLPLTWSGIMGSLIVAFVLALNGLDISFYLLGATPTMPSVAWGALRYGVKPELYALSTIINAAVFLAIIVLFLKARNTKTAPV